MKCSNILHFLSRRERDIRLKGSWSRPSQSRSMNKHGRCDPSDPRHWHHNAKHFWQVRSWVLLKIRLKVKFWNIEYYCWDVYEFSFSLMNILIYLNSFNQSRKERKSIHQLQSQQKVIWCWFILGHKFVKVFTSTDVVFYTFYVFLFMNVKLSGKKKGWAKFVPPKNGMPQSII